MKQIALFLFSAAALCAADDQIGKMLNDKLTDAQRNDACYALRNNHSTEVIAAMRGALASESVRACAARNLREAGAIDELKRALNAPEPEVRAVAARELGYFERPDLIDPLLKAAHDPNMLVATNAVMGLGQYHDRSVFPYLLELAGGSGAAGVAALSRAARFDEPATLPTARKLLSSSDVARKLLAIMIVGDCGDSGDLPRLREIALKSEPLGPPSRGFGLLPALDLARAARSAVETIEKRHGGASVSPSPS